MSLYALHISSNIFRSVGEIIGRFCNFTPRVPFPRVNGRKVNGRVELWSGRRSPILCYQFMRRGVLIAIHAGNKKIQFLFEARLLDGSHTRGACTQNAASRWFIFVAELSSFAVFLPTAGAPFIISPAALYSAVTPLRGWEIAFPLVDECSRWYTIEVAHIRGGKKQTDNGPRDFDSNRINRCRGNNPTSATCYLLYAPGYQDPPFVAPRLITMGIHRYAIDTHGVLYIHASNVRECFYCALRRV